RAVVGFGDHRREGGARKGNVHLVAHLAQGRLDHGQGEGIEAHGSAPTVILRLAASSTRALAPGSVTGGASIRSDRAGTPQRAPSGSLTRSNTCAACQRPAA